MKVVGAHVRVKTNRYLVGFAVVEDATLSRPFSLPAPAGLDEGLQLEELYRTAYDLRGEFQPEQLAIKVSEAQGKKALSVACRAEGTILAAAGARGVAVRLWYGSGLLRPSGLASGSHEARVTALCEQVSNEPISAKEVAQAVAAARASVVDAEN